MRALLAALIVCVVASSAHAEFATYYGGERHHNYCGRKTANGEIYNCGAMTAAHLSLPFGTMVHVCGPRGCGTVRINDRGPYANGAKIDLSMAAARVICGGLTSCHVSMSVGGGSAAHRGKHKRKASRLHKGSWGL